MKKSFSTGLIILLPFVLSLAVFVYVFDFFTNPLYHLLENLFLWYEKHYGVSQLLHTRTVHLLSRIAALLLTLGLVTLLGFIGRRFFFHSFLKFAHRLIFKIPLIGTLYRVTKDVTKAMLSSDQKTFKETVLIPFPSPLTYGVGFVTGSIPPQIQQHLPTADVTVFVPTAPHPISGYVLFCAKSSSIPLSISVEETFRFLLSCGVVQPSISP